MSRDYSLAYDHYRGTDAEFTELNPYLKPGELILVTDLKRIKINWSETEAVRYLDLAFADSTTDYQIVANITERNNIPVSERKQGLRVYVQNEQITYMLKSGITNSDWEEDAATQITPIVNEW